MAYNKANDEILFCNKKEFLDEISHLINPNKDSTIKTVLGNVLNKTIKTEQYSHLCIGSVQIFVQQKQSSSKQDFYKIFNKINLPIIVKKEDSLIYKNDVAHKLQLPNDNITNDYYLEKISNIDDCEAFFVLHNKIPNVSNINQAIIPSVLLDDTGKILSVSQDLKETYGDIFKPEQLIYSYLDEESNYNIKKFFKQKTPTSFEGQLKSTTDNSNIIVLLFVTPTKKGYLCQFVDITKYKNMELRFTHSQKMQAIGQLAGGVAHDFNNLLTAMIGFCDLLLMRHPAGDPSFADIMQIKQNASRAATLVKQLLAISRRQVLNPKKIDVTETITDLSDLMRRLIGEKIHFKISHSNNLNYIKVDQSQFEQVIINLVVNARDAILSSNKDSDGKLFVKTENINIGANSKINKKLINPYDEDNIVPGEYVKIDVQDNGTGIQQKILNQIFEPYFSTKELGAGTGLGLSTVYGIIKQTGGYLLINTELGKGTEFSILFPACFDDEAEANATDLYDKNMDLDLTGEETILLIEDEVPVRMFSAHALENKGYKVLQADSAEDATEIINKNTNKLDLIITDIMMPGTEGPELIKQVKDKISNVKIIFISGYTTEKLSIPGIPSNKIEFLAKPFTLKDLVIKVRSVLNKKG